MSNSYAHASWTSQLMPRTSARTDTLKWQCSADFTSVAKFRKYNINFDTHNIIRETLENVTLTVDNSYMSEGRCCAATVATVNDICSSSSSAAALSHNGSVQSNHTKTCTMLLYYTYWLCFASYHRTMPPVS